MSRCSHGVGKYSNSDNPKITQFTNSNTRAPRDWLDDQPGNYPFRDRACGPYEAIKLRNRDSNIALYNIGNYGTCYFNLLSLTYI